MVSVEAFYYLLVRFVRKEEDMREAWWTTLGTPETRQELSLTSLSLSLFYYLATIIQENAMIFCDSQYMRKKIMYMQPRKICSSLSRMQKRDLLLSLR